jgi:hypothetical protein
MKKIFTPRRIVSSHKPKKIGSSVKKLKPRTNKTRKWQV